MNQDRIKLLLTEDSLPQGGAETLMLTYLEHLDRHIFDIHLLTLRERGVLLQDAQERADHYTCAYRRLGLDFVAIIRLRKYIITRSITIIHTNQWIDTLYVYLASQGLDVVRIGTFHGFDRTWRHKVHLRLLNHFDRVLCVNRSSRLDLYRMGIPWEKMLVVNNCYDSKRFNKTPLFQEQKHNGPFQMVMVANYWWSKDQNTLIEAARLLKERGYDVELHLVGNRTSSYYDVCRYRVHQAGLEGIVKFWENKRVDQDFLSRFGLFVLSSFAENFSIALLEAMACGLPVLVSNIPGSMELIAHGEYGLYFETGNPISCAEAIARIMEDKDLCNSLRQKAYLRSQEFRPEKMTRELEKVYVKILRNSS